MLIQKLLRKFKHTKPAVLRPYEQGIIRLRGTMEDSPEDKALNDCLKTAEGLEPFALAKVTLNFSKNEVTLKRVQIYKTILDERRERVGKVIESILKPSKKA